LEIDDGLTDRGLITIAHLCPKLQSLTLTDCEDISPIGMNHIARKCHDLEYVHLRHSDWNSMYRDRPREMEAVTRESLQRLGQYCPKLNTLVF
jgi:hypothetical protein